MRRLAALLLAAPLTAAGLVVPALPAAAATPADRYVATTGADTGGCLRAAHPCQTVDYAIGQASAGDTVSIAAGTYHQTVTVTTPVNLVGAGAGTTILSGLGAPESNSAEIDLHTTAAGPVNITGMTVNNARTAGMGAPAADIVNLGVPLPLTVDHVLLGGVANPGPVLSYGLITFPGGAVTLRDSTVQNLNVGVANEGAGALTVTGDTFQQLRSRTVGSSTTPGVGVISEPSIGGSSSPGPSSLTATGNVFQNYAGIGVAAGTFSGNSCTSSCAALRVSIAANTFTLGGAKALGPFPAAAIELVSGGTAQPIVARVYMNTGTVTAPTRAQFTLSLGGDLALSEHNNSIKVV